MTNTSQPWFKFVMILLSCKKLFFFFFFFSSVASHRGGVFLPPWSMPSLYSASYYSTLSIIESNCVNSIISWENDIVRIAVKLDFESSSRCWDPSWGYTISPIHHLVLSSIMWRCRKYRDSLISIVSANRQASRTLFCDKRQNLKITTSLAFVITYPENLLMRTASNNS